MEILNTANAVILDTETTGLGSDAEIVEIALIDATTLQTLYTSLVKPTSTIPAGAQNIHGISNDMVNDAPSFDEIWPNVSDLMVGRQVLIYNADYDSRLIIQSLSACDYPTTSIRFDNLVCVMDWYSQFFGEWNELQGNFKWQSLTNACFQQNVDITDLSAHRAHADCIMTGRLVHAVNAQLDA